MKRYTPYFDDDIEVQMDFDVNGEWCRFIDHQAALKELAADAARYRWLRKFPTHFATEEFGKYGAGLRLDKIYINTPEKLDAAIDEVIAAYVELKNIAAQLVESQP